MTEGKGRASDLLSIRVEVPLEQIGAGEPIHLRVPPEQLAEFGRGLAKVLVDELLKQGYVVVPRTEYETLRARLEDLADAARVREGEARGGPSPDALPAELVNRLMEGEHPLRIWREHRGLTLAALAERAGVPDGYISEIETGKKPGSIRTLKALAHALDVDLDDLVP